MKVRKDVSLGFFLLVGSFLAISSNALAEEISGNSSETGRYVSTDQGTYRKVSDDPLVCCKYSDEYGTKFFVEGYTDKGCRILFKGRAVGLTPECPSQP